MSHDEHSSMKGAHITLEKLAKHFGKIVAVEEISLDIQKGEFMTFLGPSGSGKSTLLHLLGGMDEPTCTG